MESDPRALLFEIAESSGRILEFTAGIGATEYINNPLIKSAAERLFIIIGEALNRLKQIDRPLFESIVNAPRIIGFRNTLVHGYDLVSDELVWEIISENVPDLKNLCKRILSK